MQSKLTRERKTSVKRLESLCKSPEKILEIISREDSSVEAETLIQPLEKFAPKTTYGQEVKVTTRCFSLVWWRNRNNAFSRISRINESVRTFGVTCHIATSETRRG